MKLWLFVILICCNVFKLKWIEYQRKKAARNNNNNNNNSNLKSKHAKSNANSKNSSTNKSRPPQKKARVTRGFDNTMRSVLQMRKEEKDNQRADTFAEKLLKRQYYLIMLRKKEIQVLCFVCVCHAFVFPCVCVCVCVYVCVWCKCAMTQTKKRTNIKLKQVCHIVHKNKKKTIHLTSFHIFKCKLKKN